MTGTSELSRNPLRIEVECTEIGDQDQPNTPPPRVCVDIYDDPATFAALTLDAAVRETLRRTKGQGDPLQELNADTIEAYLTRPRPSNTDVGYFVNDGGHVSFSNRGINKTGRADTTRVNEHLTPYTDPNTQGSKTFARIKVRLAEVEEQGKYQVPFI